MLKGSMPVSAVYRTTTVIAVAATSNDCTVATGADSSALASRTSKKPLELIATPPQVSSVEPHPPAAHEGLRVRQPAGGHGARVDVEVGRPGPEPLPHG